MAGEQSHVLVEKTVEIGALGGSHTRISRILRTYTDKSVAEDALALLRDAFEPEHERQFDLITAEHID